MTEEITAQDEFEDTNSYPTYPEDYTALKDAAEFLQVVGDNGAEWGRAVAQFYHKLYGVELDPGFLGFWFANAIESTHEFRKGRANLNIDIQDKTVSEPTGT